MEVTATKKVCYDSIWYEAGDTFRIKEEDYALLSDLNAVESQGKSKAKLNKAVKDLKTR